MQKIIRLITTFFGLLACLSYGTSAEPNEGVAARRSAPLSVLFIGNSYTYSNGMPNTLSILATSTPDRRRLKVREATMGGASLEKLWSRSATKDALSSAAWDFVVLQEQSALPTIDPELMNSAARQIDSEIVKAGAKTILFLTWAYRGKPEMQPLLNRAYITLARELNAKVVPVGPAWRIALDLDPLIPLHAADGSHPTPTGSYLTACVFYLSLVRAGQGCPTTAISKVSPRHAAISRAAALQAVALSQDDILRAK